MSVGPLFLTTITPQELHLHMAVVFTQVFSCCLQRKPSKSRIVSDEESRLILANGDIEPSETSASDVLSTQKMKARMLKIVRAKESKMVNVTSRLPFNNLHNKNVSITPHKEGARASLIGFSSSTPSYSRSVSASSLPPPFSTQLGVNYTPSRSSSTALCKHPLNEDYTENEYEPSGSGSRSRTGTPRPPAFNIRMVQGLSLNPALGVRRGRPKERAASENGEILGPDIAAGILSQDDHVRAPAEGFPAGQVIPTVSVEHSSVMAMQAPDYSGSIPKSFSSVSILDFKLQDSGLLVVDWDD